MIKSSPPINPIKKPSWNEFILKRKKEISVHKMLYFKLGCGYLEEVGGQCMANTEVPYLVSESLDSEKRIVIDSAELFLASIEKNLMMSYEERIDAHENARRLAADLMKAGEPLRGES